MKDMLETWVAEQDQRKTQHVGGISPTRSNADWTESEFFEVWLRLARDRKLRGENPPSKKRGS